MITRSSALLQRPDREARPLPLQARWQTQLARAIRDPRELCRRLGLDETWWPGAERGHALFEVRVPEAYLARIRPRDPADPLHRLS